MENLDRLTEQVDEALEALGWRPRVEPPEGLIYRVKAAVRHELNEAWLARQPEPLPSADAVRRVREALHGELQRSGGAPAEMMTIGCHSRRFRWSPPLASLAAAAMIALCAGVVQYAGTLKPPALFAGNTAQARLDLFVDAAQEVLTEDSQTASIGSDLKALEQDLTEPLPVKDPSTQELDETVKEIDQLLSEPEPGKSMSGTHALPGGAFG